MTQNAPERDALRAAAGPRDSVFIDTDIIRSHGIEAAYLLAAVDARWIGPNDPPEQMAAAMFMPLRDVRKGLRALANAEAAR